MAKFRKKPVIIEAEQYQGAAVAGVCTCMSDEVGKVPHVHTIHGGQAVRLEVGDWIIPESDGTHFYPCKAADFVERYEPVTEQEGD